MADILRARLRQSTDDGPKEVRAAGDGDARQSDSLPSTLPAVVAKSAADDSRIQDRAGSGQQETSSGSPTPKALPKGVVLGKDGKP